MVKLKSCSFILFLTKLQIDLDASRKLKASDSDSNYDAKLNAF